MLSREGPEPTSGELMFQLDEVKVGARHTDDEFFLSGELPDSLKQVSTWTVQTV